jgi:integrase
VARHRSRQRAVENRLVEEHGLQPLPLGISPHNPRHIFASILVAGGKDPTYVIQQLGRTDPAVTLRAYSRTMRRGQEERERLKALVQGRARAANGQRESAPSQPAHRTTNP